MTSRNVGDLLTQAGVTWGWFYNTFARIGSNADGTAICSPAYNNHYAPFMYYASTSNPHHLPPSSVGMIGQTGPGEPPVTDSAVFADRSKELAADDGNAFQPCVDRGLDPRGNGATAGFAHKVHNRPVSLRR